MGSLLRCSSVPSGTFNVRPFAGSAPWAFGATYHHGGQDFGASEPITNTTNIRAEPLCKAQDWRRHPVSSSAPLRPPCVPVPAALPPVLCFVLTAAHSMTGGILNCVSWKEIGELAASCFDNCAIRLQHRLHHLSIFSPLGAHSRCALCGFDSQSCPRATCDPLCSMALDWHGYQR